MHHLLIVILFVHIMKRLVEAYEAPRDGMGPGWAKWNKMMVLLTRLRHFRICYILMGVQVLRGDGQSYAVWTFSMGTLLLLLLQKVPSDTVGSSRSRHWRCELRECANDDQFHRSDDEMFVEVRILV